MANPAPSDDPPDQTVGNIAGLVGIAGAESTAINVISGLIGAAADLSGAFGLGTILAPLIISGIESFLGGGSGGGATSAQDFLNAIEDAIQSAFTQAGYHDGANEALTRSQLCNGFLYGPEGSYICLQTMAAALVSGYPPIQSGDITNWLTWCSGDVFSLSLNNDQIANVTFAWQPYWSDSRKFWTAYWIQDSTGGWSQQSAQVDVGYGLQAPNQNADGTAFSYTYSLPCFLCAISNFVAVGVALVPQFTTNPIWRSYLEKMTSDLITKHDKVRDGISILSPPKDILWDWDSITPLSYSGTKGVRTMFLDLAPDGSNSATPITDTHFGAIIEYGAVEIYSGYSDVEPNYILADNQTVNHVGSTAGAYNKFQLRVKQKAKNVYAAVGLVDAWNSINQLNALLGEAVMPRPNFGDWSFRNEIFPTTQIPPANDGTRSLKGLAKFLLETLPVDTFGGNGPGISIRALLNPKWGGVGPEAPLSAVNTWPTPTPLPP